jgi:hypothetical protein
MNEMIGDKICDSLISLNVKLLLGHQHTAEIFTDNPLDLVNQLDDLVARSEHGSLLLFLMISLEIYIRYNNGQANTNSILTSPNHLSKSIKLLNSLAHAIHQNNDSILIKLIYAQFLVKLFRINFKNNQMRLKENLIISNSLFLDQFSIFKSAFNDKSAAAVNEQLVELSVQLAVDYLFEYSNLSHFPRIYYGREPNYPNSIKLFSSEESYKEALTVLKQEKSYGEPRFIKTTENTLQSISIPVDEIFGAARIYVDGFGWRFLIPNPEGALKALEVLKSTSGEDDLKWIKSQNGKLSAHQESLISFHFRN